jgi:hypothetical protein
VQELQELLTEDDTPTAQILANRVFLFDPLDRGRDNPDFWSRECCRTAIAQLSSIPQHEATTLFQPVLTGSDQTKLKHIMRAQAAALAASLECDDYQAAGRHWQLLTRLSVIGHDEVEQMVGEYALSRVQQHVLRCVGTFQEHAMQDQFDQAEGQLSLLRMLTSHLPSTDLQVSLSALEALLVQCQETQKEEQKRIDSQLVLEKQRVVQKFREETEREIQQMISQLETVMRQMGMNENEQQRLCEMAQEARITILEGSGKNFDDL